MSDLMKQLDKLHRMKIFKVDTNPMGVILKDSTRGPLVNFEQVKTVVGQWIADNKPKTDGVRRLVSQWFDELDKHPEMDFDDMAFLEALLQAEVERRLTLAKSETSG